MRIYSKFPDYYDNVMSHGIDPTIFYKRITSDEYYNDSEIYKKVYKAIPDINTILDFYNTQNYNSKKIFISRIFIVIFCGYIITGLKIKKPGDQYRETSSVISYAYTYDQAMRFFKKYKYKIEKKEKKKRSKYNNNWRKFNKLNQESLNMFFQLNDLSRKESVMNLHFDLDTPIIYIENEHNYADNNSFVLLNPSLQNIQFYKSHDSYTTYQEIAMFISGVMGGQVPKMIEITDKYKIAKHGYNEWSLRKEPESKR